MKEALAREASLKGPASRGKKLTGSVAASSTYPSAVSNKRSSRDDVNKGLKSASSNSVRNQQRSRLAQGVEESATEQMKSTGKTMRSNSGVNWNNS